MTRILALLAILWSSTSLAGALGVASDFNTFIFGDFYGSSDTEGRLAVGGNATLEHYSVGDKLDSSSAGTVLVVGGDLTITGGRVYYGDAYVGGNTYLPGYQVVDGDLNVGSVPIDFVAAQLELTSLSLNLAQVTATGDVTSQYGTVTFSGDGLSSLQIFYITGDMLSSANTLDISGIPDGATVVINVSGSYASLLNMGMWAFDSIKDKVLFNFYEADTLDFGGVAILGSVLAPNATINASYGVIWGTTIAENWYGPMQQNNVPFTGDLPDFGTPTITVSEPPITLLLAGMLSLLLVVRRKTGR